MEDVEGDVLHVDSSQVQRRQRRTEEQPDEEVAKAPQMRRKGGQNNGIAFVMLAFVLLVVGAWWGLMTAVMGTRPVTPHRVTVADNVRDLLEDHNLRWDTVYANHIHQTGWVLDERGDLVEVGFPDGTSRWYPKEAVVDAAPQKEAVLPRREASLAKRKTTTGVPEKAKREKPSTQHHGQTADHSHPVRKGRGLDHETGDDVEDAPKTKPAKKVDREDAEDTDPKPAKKRHRAHFEDFDPNRAKKVHREDAEDIDPEPEKQAHQKGQRNRGAGHLRRHDDGLQDDIGVVVLNDSISLASYKPKDKQGCTYPVLHPHKWSEKLGWGQKKEFAPCSSTGDFAKVFEPEDAQVEEGAEVTLRLDDAVLKFTAEAGDGNGQPITLRVTIDEGEAQAVQRIRWTPHDDHVELTVNREIKARVTRKNKPAPWNLLNKLRAFAEKTRTQHALPRILSMKFNCKHDDGKVVAFDELPDSFFTKMRTTLDAEKRQNELRALFTSKRQKHTTHKPDDEGFVYGLTSPYLLATCGDDEQLHINVGAQPRYDRRPAMKAKKLNVMHVMFDSSSYPALVRACPKTIRTLEALNNAHDSPSKVYTFKHLHAVSCCSPGNQIPMYSGRMNGEGSPFVAAEPRQGSKNWLWNMARSLGYHTFWSLDNCPDKSARDFQAFPATDHRVVAPICLAGVLLSHTERPCLGKRPIDAYLFDAVAQFWNGLYPSSEGYAKYAALQFITPHEPTEKLLIELDVPMERFLSELRANGTLEDTAVIFFSDHGINFGKYASTHDGEIEKMFPFAHVVLPRWLENDAAFNLRALRSNEDALVTPYDVHQLIRELLSYPRPAPPYDIDPEDPPLPRPESSHIVASMKTLKPAARLLHDVLPAARGCLDANIPPEFCTCIAWQQVEASAYQKQVAALVAEHKQATAALSQCELVELDEVVSVELQVWPTEYHPKEQPKAKKVWMAPNRDMLRVRYSIKNVEGSLFEGVMSLVKGDYQDFDVSLLTRIDAMKAKCGVVEKRAELLCVCKDDGASG